MASPQGSIYQAKCKTTGKVYIGQTQDTKCRDGKPYKYGIIGRWSDHVSSAHRISKTPLARAILEYGADDFELTPIELNIADNKLDEREAHWIAHYKATVPNGYNVMKHSRCKHRESSSIAEHYIKTTINVRISTVKRKGVSRLVYVYLDQTEGPSVRIVFGQGADATYEQTLEEAQEFAAYFAENGLDVSEEDAEDSLRKYREKIESLEDKTIEKIRIAKFNELVALYIKHDEGTLRICFGGKKISFEDACKTAHAVKNAIIEAHNTENIIVQDDVSRSATGGCP
jgi:hypothetical protein